MNFIQRYKHERPLEAMKDIEYGYKWGCRGLNNIYGGGMVSIINLTVNNPIIGLIGGFLIVKGVLLDLYPAGLVYLCSPIRFFIEEKMAINREKRYQNKNKDIDETQERYCSEEQVQYTKKK